MRPALLLPLLAAVSAASMAAPGSEVEAARKRWAESPHGPMLERLLPPTFDPAKLPQPKSRGAQLTLAYCVQCHNLANPAMHHAEKWPAIVDRMVVRMEGRGNMGTLMAEMMAGVKAPDAEEKAAIVAYLQRHAQKPLDRALYPEVDTPAGEAFRLACDQCHVLPDPKRHTAREWPGVVARMQKNMEWMNRIVGSRRDPDEPQLRVDEINAFLRRHARR